MMTAALLSILAVCAVAYGMLYERRMRNDRHREHVGRKTKQKTLVENGCSQ